MASSPNTEKVIAYALLVLTAVTGLVDAVSFLSLGHVFTANMTGNIVLLAFATAHVSGLSIARSLTALLAFLVGAILGGRAMARANPDSQIRFAAQAFLLEVAFLFAASFCAIGYRGDLLEDSFQPFALITLTALAMGARNAAVRKLAIPDLTTTVLTLTITGIGADSCSQTATTRDWREGLRRWPQCSWVRRWVRSSYITRSQRPCGLGQRSPPRAVRHYFARCARPISSDGESRFSAGELYLTHRSTVQTTVAEPDATVP